MKKTTLIACLLFVMTATGAQAGLNITDKSVDRDNRLLNLKGESGKANAIISLNIPITGKTAQDLEKATLPGELIFYNDELICDDNGKFSIDIELPENMAEGKYTVYLGGIDDETENFTVWFSEKESYDTQISILNSLARENKYSEFKQELETNGWIAGLSTDEKTESTDTLTKIIFDYAKNTGLDKDSKENIRVYNSGIVAELLLCGKIANAEKIMPDMYLSDKEMLDDYITYITDEKEKAFFAKKFEACKDLKTFESSFLDALILTTVKHSDGTGDVKTVLKKYSDYLNVDVKNAGPDDYSYIAGDEFSNIEDLISTFNTKVKKSESTTSSGGGGGGGNSGSGNKSNQIVSNLNINPIPQQINIKFEDLNPVPWAYTAISNLFVKGIINGRSETKFAPNETVKREEFVKMLVQMADITVLKYENEFSDVIPDAWYEDYVNTAYNNGIVKGIGKGEFGVGKNISREDMCVMAYNTLLKMGITLPSGTNSFSDESDISEYAKSPVKALNSAGVVNGIGDNLFNPKGNATRAEAAVIIYNTLQATGGLK